MINATTNMNLLVDVGPFFIAKSWRRGGGMLDEICGFILWSWELMNRKVRLDGVVGSSKIRSNYSSLFALPIRAFIVPQKN